MSYLQFLNTGGKKLKYFEYFGILELQNWVTKSSYAKWDYT